MACWRPNAAGYALDLGPGTGTYRDARTLWTFVFHNLPAAKVHLDGQPVRARRVKSTLVVQIPNDGAKHSLKL